MERERERERNGFWRESERKEKKEKREFFSKVFLKQKQKTCEPCTENENSIPITRREAERQRKAEVSMKEW